MGGQTRPCYVRGLTLWRPWPWAFEHAGKRVENRGWRPGDWMNLGWIALHAGQKFDHDAADEFVLGTFGPNAMRCPPTQAEHPHGVIFAVAQFLHSYDVDHTQELEPWAFGPYVWVLHQYTPLKTPIPCKGAQGLWKIPPAMLPQLQAVIPDAVQ